MTDVVQVTGLVKRFGDVIAVNDISFSIRKGEIFSLLGPNGAGKTTTLECLEGLRTPDAGMMRIFDADVARSRGRLHNLIGVQLQTSGLPANMTVHEAMRFFCAYHRVPVRDDLLERLGLGARMDAQYQELSTGQQRRLALALAVAHNPPVVFLDEPTAGLDVASRVELHAMMQELQGQGATIVLATHDMAEAEKMSTRVAILLRGKIVATGTPMELTATGASLTKISVRSEGSCLHGKDIAFPGVESRVVSDDYAIYFSTDPGPSVTAIMNYISAQGDKLIDLRVERPSLEERFLEITTARGAA